MLSPRKRIRFTPGRKSSARPTESARNRMRRMRRIKWRFTRQTLQVHALRLLPSDLEPVTGRIWAPGAQNRARCELARPRKTLLEVEGRLTPATKSVLLCNVRELSHRKTVWRVHVRLLSQPKTLFLCHVRVPQR